MQTEFQSLPSIVISAEGVIEVMAYVIGALLRSSTSISTATNRVICMENKMILYKSKKYVPNILLGHQGGLLEWCVR